MENGKWKINNETYQDYKFFIFDFPLDIMKLIRFCFTLERSFAIVVTVIFDAENMMNWCQFS